MCGSMVDIQSATAEIRRGKKEERRRKKKPQGKNIMSASATQGGHKNHRMKISWPALSIGGHKKVVYTTVRNQVKFSPRPPTLSNRHMDLHVSHPRRSYIFQVSLKSVQGFWSPWSVEICPFPLLWLLSFTTACNTVQAVTTNGENNFTIGRIAVAHGRFSGIRQVAPV